jgi:hypothetical protein
MIFHTFTRNEHLLCLNREVYDRSQQVATVIKRAADSTCGKGPGVEIWNYEKEPTVLVGLMLHK